MSVKIERRQFLHGVGIAAGAAAAANLIETSLIEQPVLAQGARQASEKLMTDPARIIDFHCHHIPARFEVTAARTAPSPQRARWQALAGTLASEEFLLKDIREGNLEARVVSILIQLIADADGRVPPKPSWP